MSVSASVCECVEASRCVCVWRPSGVCVCDKQGGKVGRCRRWGMQYVAARGQVGRGGRGFCTPTLALLALLALDDVEQYNVCAVRLQLPTTRQVGAQSTTEWSDKSGGMHAIRLD